MLVAVLFVELDLRRPAAPSMDLPAPTAAGQLAERLRSAPLVGIADPRDGIRRRAPAPPTRLSRLRVRVGTAWLR